MSYKGFRVINELRRVYYSEHLVFFFFFPSPAYVLDDLFTISYSICRNILKHKANFEWVPAGNWGRLVKFAHLKFGGKEPVHQVYF